MHTYRYAPFADDDKRIVSQGKCTCGWVSPERRDADDCRDDYRDHVHGAVGLEQAYYEAPVICVNCSYEGPTQLLLGTDVWSGICPRCMAHGRLRPNNETLRSEHERMGRW